ncbi:aldo-keto reductase family protein [Pedobacter hiemivivus]|uniref:Uncharacterized protein n=1 Tax=Pedobacter hiemivivus TaxID=2530454 RepID=A0A4R0N8L4_9SPHI|nr:hypothetical protein [Pedobacter hiemivivus]TCC96498.1 hypothetical protein EZ444_10975 [Pedobacter hiemivivus]
MIKLTSGLFNDLITGKLKADSFFGLWYSRRREGNMISIQNCVIEQPMIFEEDLKCDFHIEFLKCEFISSLQIRNGIYKNLIFRDVKQHEKSSIELGVEECGGVSFIDNCVFNGYFNFEKGSYNKIHVQDVNFKTLTFDNGAYKYIYFGTSGFSGGLFFKNGVYEILRLAGIKSSGLYFEHGKYLDLSIESVSQVETIYFTYGSFSLLSFASENISKIVTTTTIDYDRLHIEQLSFAQLGKITALFDDAIIDSIIFSPAFMNKDAVLRFQNVTSNSLRFKSFINYGQVSFFDLRLDGELLIQNSDLGKTAFISCTIKGALLNLDNSKITDASFNNTAFPIRIAQDNNQQRLAYAQLKKISESKGDYLEANRFYSSEMNSFYESITWKKNFWEKLNLSFNKYSNNHGQSWELALFCILLLSIATYLLYLHLLGIRPGHLISSKDRDYFWKCLSYYFDFLNPVHRTDEIAKGLSVTAASTARIIEGASRIFIAFGIYQFVQAFRKHGKK